MKKNSLWYLLLLTYNCFSQAPSFTIQNISLSTSITCVTPSIHLIAYSSAPNVATYSWVSSGASLTGTTVLLNTPGVYTVSAVSGTVSMTQTISIGINTVQPAATISPLSQTISCSSSPIQVTAASVVSNVFHTFKSSYGATYAVNTQTAHYLPGGPGTYTYVVTNAVNGCTASHVLSVAASPGFPTASLVSTSNFSIGCLTRSVSVITVSNAATHPPSGPVSYTIQGFPTITGTGVYSITTPGSWTITLKDNNSLCETKIPFTITQNTVAPDLFALVPKQLLDCNTPGTVLEAFSSTPVNSIAWIFQGVPVGSSNTIAVVTKPFTPTATLINTFTLIVHNPYNSCHTSSVVPMYQNIFPPLAKITSNGLERNCFHEIILTNASQTGIPQNSIFPNVLPVVPVSWEPNNVMLPITNTWVALAGTHTLTVRDLNNGCTSHTTITISENLVFPHLQSPPPFLVICPDGTVTISPAVIGTTAPLSFSWQVIPNAIVSGTNTAFLTTNAPGPYTVTATNTLNGCATTTLVYVYACVNVAENDLLSGVSVYPNPFKNTLNLQLSNTLIIPLTSTIRNLSGQIIYEEKNDQTRLDLTALSPGLYFLELRSTNAIHIFKIIKE